MEQYVEKLCEEIKYTAQTAQKAKLKENLNENEEDESLVNDWSDKLSKDGYVKGIDISNWQKSMDYQ